MRPNKQMLGMVSRHIDRTASGGDARFFSNVERTTPVRPPDLTADVLVPLAQMGVCGVGAFCITFPVAAFIIGPVGGLAVAAIVAGVAAGVSTLWVLDWKHATIYSVELYRDNLTATSQNSAETTVETIDLRVTREDLNSQFPPVQIRNIPIDRERLTVLAQAAIAGRPLTQDEFSGSDKLLSRSEFDKTMQTLMELGILAWKSSRDNAQGRVITAGGRHALQAIMNGRAQVRTQATSSPAETAGEW